MRILWFSVTPSLYNPNSNFHNGGGWIASLEQIVRKEKTIELGVAFCFEADGWRHEVDGVTYYTIGSKKNNLDSYLKIIEDFKPDLIQIFGSENEFGIIYRTRTRMMPSMAAIFSVTSSQTAPSTSSTV